MTPSIQLEGNLNLLKIKKESNDEQEEDPATYLFGQPLTKAVHSVDSSTDEETDKKENEEEEEEEEEAQEEHQKDATTNREEEEEEEETEKENEIADNEMDDNPEGVALFGEAFKCEEMTDNVHYTPSGTKRRHSGASSNTPKRKRKN